MTSKKRNKRFAKPVPAPAVTPEPAPVSKQATNPCPACKAEMEVQRYEDGRVFRYRCAACGHRESPPLA